MTADVRGLPRIYLDTAVLADIGDGQAKEADIASLLQAVERARAVLIVSIGHVFDVARCPDTETRDRIGAAIDAFPLKLAVMSLPVEVEKQCMDAVLLDGVAPESIVLPDLDLAELTSFSDFSNANGLTGGPIDLVGGVLTQNHAAQLLSWQAQAGPEDEPDEYAEERREIERAVRKSMPELVSATSIDELMSITRRHVEPVIARLRARGRLPPPATDGGPVAAEELGGEQLSGMEHILRQSIEGLQPTAAALGVSVRDVLAGAAKHPESARFGFAGVGVRGGLARWLDVARAVAPGTYLAARLATMHERDRAREPGPGDIADQIHASCLPHVDLATVDRYAYGPLAAAAREVVHGSHPVLLKNPGPRFAMLIGAVEELGRRLGRSE